ncbi:MAG: hypothetical protein IJA12_08375 [Oscillospiraceae bacterium]|nr:hypothetical protein [Oscillospiraceae bacterium]
MKYDPRDVDIVSLRRKKKRRRQLTKFTIFALIVTLGITAYVKVDDWFPKLEGIGSRFQSVKSNNGDSADGNFPLSVSGGIDYQVGNLNDYLAILSDAYLYIYDQDGDLYDERQHAYANAMMQTAEKKVLIYESGGNNFRVDSRRKNLYSKKLDNTIVFARISESGSTAIITNSDNYACKLLVFDDTGNQIYSRNCVERVVDIAFNESSTGCVLSTSDAQNGELVTKLISVDFNSEKDKWTSEAFSTMCLKTCYDENGIFLIGDTKCAYYDSKGKQTLTYDYPSTLIDWDYSADGAALLFENETKRQSYFTTINSKTKEICEKEFDVAGSKCIQIAERYVYVMNKNGISRFGFKGTEETNISSENSYDGFIIIEDYIFQLGYDRIDRTEYKE